MDLSNLFGALSTPTTTTNTPSTSDGLLGILNTAVGTAGQVYTATQANKGTQATQQAAATTAAASSMTTKTMLIIAGVGGAILLVIFWLANRK